MKRNAMIYPIRNDEIKMAYRQKRICAVSVDPFRRVAHRVNTVDSIPSLLSCCFLLFVFTIPIEVINVSLDLGPITLARFTGLLFAAVSLLYPKKCYSDLPTALLWFGGYLLVLAVSGVLKSSAYASMVVTQISTLIQLLAFFWSGSNLMKNEKLARTVSFVFALGSVLLVIAVKLRLLGFSQVVLNPNTENNRLTATGFDPNQLGALLAITAVILLGLTLDKKLRISGKKVFFLLLTALVLAFLIQTGSRSASAIFIIGISCYAWPSGLTRKRKIVAITLVSFALLSAGYLLWSNAGLRSRWSAAISEGDSAGRDRIYPAAFVMITERPYWGWGPVAYASELSDRVNYRGPFRNPHNIVLEVLLEVGLLGGIIYFVAIWLCGHAAWKSRGGELGILPFALFIMLFVFLQFNPWSRSKPLWLVLALCTAAAKSCPQKSESDARLSKNLKRIRGVR